MMTFETLSCGPLTTIQDAGRHGLRHLGIGQSGAMDSIALAQVNLLLGNDVGAAILEIRHGPLRLHCHRDCRIALAGTDFRGQVTDAANRPLHPLFPGQVRSVVAGEIVHLPGPLAGKGCAALGIAGGFDVPVVLGSRSTDVNNGFGGLCGRPLRSGDRLRAAANPGRGLLPGAGIRSLRPRPILRALAGPEYDRFSSRATSDLWEEHWTVSPDSNRMGIRLQGASLQSSDQGSLPSSAVLPGVIQVPPDGQPIILGSDAQTTGGYPRIASLITADLWLLAHVGAGDRIRIVRVDPDEARNAAHRQRIYLEHLARASGQSVPLQENDDGPVD